MSDFGLSVKRSEVSHRLIFNQSKAVRSRIQEKALKGIRNLVADSVFDMGKTDEPIPEPIASKHFSGKFMVRVPSEVHRQLAIQAAESGVSLNRIASSKLSQ